MRITVVYQNGDTGSVDPKELEELIQTKKIRKFLRAEGWCTIGTDPTRQAGNADYTGPERRGRPREAVKK